MSADGADTRGRPEVGGRLSPQARENDAGPARTRDGTRKSDELDGRDAPRPALSFDVYGTLAAWDETLRAAVAAALPAAAPEVAARAARILDAESRRLQTIGAFRPYVDILRESATLALSGQSVAGGAVDDILDRLADVPPHPEVPSVLAALARDYRLVAISNSDEAFLAKTLGNLGDVWNGVATAEQARAYKPNPALFRYAQARHALDKGHHVHIAQGMFSDIAVCAGLGIPTIWINRTGTTLQHGLTPRATLPDLAALADTIAAIDM